MIKSFWKEDDSKRKSAYRFLVFLISMTLLVSNNLKANTETSTVEKQKNYFLILSNGRSGSTWLQNLLGDLLNCVTKYELKWPLGKNYTMAPVHIKVGTNDLDIKYKIDCIRKQIKLSSSIDKLVLDPYGFLHESAFNELCSYLEKNQDIRLIFLKRNYYELFLSWNCRGVHHRFRTGQTFGSGEIYHIFMFGIPNFPEDQVLKNYNLCQDKKIGMHFSEAKRKFFIFFYNDVMIAEMLRRLDSYMVVDYQNIEQDFRKILEFLGINVSDAKIESVIKKPHTIKLPTLEGLVYPKDPLANLASLLEKKLQSILNKEKKASDFFSWDNKSEKILIHDPELLKVFGTEFLIDAWQKEIQNY